MRDSCHNAHQSLVEQAERREAIRRAMLNRPSEARRARDRTQRAQREPESRGIDPLTRRTGFAVLVWAVLYGTALGVIALDLFFWRP